MTEPEKVSSASSSVLSGLRILIIESNLDNASLFTTILSEAGAEVIEANLASTGLVALEREQPDLVIISLRLTDEDGFSLIRKIRNDSSFRNRRIPAIALETFWDTEICSTTAKEAGFQEFFAPQTIQVDDFIAAIVRLIKK
jgi:CheY-like chemotaxis protein